MAMMTVTATFNDDGTVTVRGAEGVRNMTVAKFTEMLSNSAGNKVVDKHAAHSHIWLDEKTGKFVHNDGDHTH